MLRRRLFASIDESRIPAVVDAYRALWKQHESVLSSEAARPDTVEAFRAKAGGPHANGRSVVLADGTKVFSGNANEQN